MTDEPTTSAPASHGLKVLFFLRGIHFGRIHENLLRGILERGHELHVALAVEKRGWSERTQLFDELGAAYPGFSYEQLDPRTGTWDQVVMALRHGIDYMRYLEPEYANAEPLRNRARDRAPAIVRGLLVFPMRGRIGRRIVNKALRWIEAAAPVPASLKKLVVSRSPDVVLVSPLVGLGSLESEYVRAAQAAQVPTVLPVASWDNLSNKGLLRDVPTLTIVWNGTQVEEAVKLHGLPPDQVVAVGAHAFDHWFDWSPHTSREAFAAHLGLEPERPTILYLGSSFFITGDESVFAREWLEHIREHPRLRDAAVVFRPHPYNTAGWDTVEDDPGRMTVWPRAGAVPDDKEKRTEYFDALYHSSAVVGVNTSALIEASILRRPVLSLVSDHFSTQDGTLHFSYIAHDGNDAGVVTIGRSWDEHMDQIADAIESPQGYDERFERFLSQFIRPNGLDVPAGPLAVDAIERAAATPVQKPRPSLLRPLLVALTPLMWLLMPLFRPRRTMRMATKSSRKVVKFGRTQRKRVERRRKERAKARKAREKARSTPAKIKGTVPTDKPAKPPKAAKPPKPIKPSTDGGAPTAMPDAQRDDSAKPAKAEKPAKARKAAKSGLSDVDLALMSPEEIAEYRARKRAEMRRQARQGSKGPDPAKPRKAAKVKAQRATAAAGAAAAAAAGAGSKAAKPAKPAKKKKAPPFKARARKTAKRVRKRARRTWKLTKRGVVSTYNIRRRPTYKSTIFKVPSRDEIPQLLNRRGLTGIGAEIGVKRGGFSEFLLKNWKGETLISIDPWLSVDWEEYVDRSNVAQDEFDENFVITRDRLAPYGSRSQIWRLMSVEAAERIADGTLDFVYIDARHDYESVLEDLEAWYSKVKPGGVLAGHDYIDGLVPQGDFGVKSAVDEFFGARDIKVHGTEGPSPVELFPSWIVEIPMDGRNLDERSNGAQPHEPTSEPRPLQTLE